MASIVSKRQGLPVAIFVAAAGCCAGTAQAQDATWLLNPASNNFGTGANWSPATVPTGTASFNTSNVTSIVGGGAVDTLQFNSGASAFTFSGGFKLSGLGIVNNSASTQTFNVSSAISFENSATASNATIVNAGSVSFQGASSAAFSHIGNFGFLLFSQNSTGGAALIGTATGALTQFADNSTAANSSQGIENGGTLQFTDNANGGNALIATLPGAVVDFSGTAGAAGNSQVTAGSIEGGGQFNLGSNRLTVGSNSLSTSVTGVIADGGSAGGSGASLVKVGTGTLTLQGANTFTGATTINGGTLALGSGGSLSSSLGVNLATSGVTFDISGGGNQTIKDLSGVGGTSLALGANALTAGTGNSTTFAGVISGTGGLIKAGAGALVLSGANTFSGGTTINAGTLQVSADNNLGDPNGALTFNGGALQFGSSFNLSNTRAITLNANATIDTNGFNTTIAQAITGTGGLIKVGAGALSLIGANTFTGGTSFNAGTIILNSNAVLGTGAVTMANGTILQAAANGLSFANPFVLNGGTETVDTQNNHLALTGVISGTGSLNKAGLGLLDLSAAETFTGATTINGGTLALAAGGSLAASSGVNVAAANASFDISGAGNQTVQNLAGVNGSFLVLGANTLTEGSAVSTTFGGSISGTGGLTKIGTGALTLSGASTFSGGTTLSAGTIGVGNNAALGTGALAMANGTALQAAVNGLSLANAISVAGTDTIDTQGNTLTLAGVISGAGGVIKAGAGTLTLTGIDTFTGGVTVNAGTFAVGAGGSIVGGSGINLAVAGAAFDISAAGGTQTIGDFTGVAGTAVNLGANTLSEGAGNATIFAGTIAGSGGLAINGGGTLTLTGANTFSGGTALNAGTVVVTNNSALGTGALTMANATALTAGANNLSLGNSIVLASALAPTVQTVDTLNNNLTLTGVISGAGELLKGGAGTLTLTNTNSFTGGTDLLSGTLALANNAALGTGALTMEAGTTLQAAINVLSLGNAVVLVGADTIDTQGNRVNLTGGISGTGSLTAIGNGTLTLIGASTFSGGTVLTAGTLAVANNTALGTGALTMADGTTLAASAANLSLANAVVLGGADTVNTQGNVLTLAGIVSGGGSLTKIGAGTLTLSGANTFTGGTTVNAGTLAIGAGGSIAASSGVNLAVGNTAFDISAGGNQTVQDLTGVGGTSINLGANTLTEGTANSTIFAGVITGTGGLTKIGAGTLTLAAASTFSGGTALNAGTLAVGNGAALGTGALTMAGGTILQAAANNLTLGNAVVLNDGETIDTQANTLTLAGVVSSVGSLTKIGTGTVVLAGANTFSGGTTINTGVVQAGADINLGAATGGLTFNGGTLRFGAGFNLANTRAITLNSTGTIDTNTFNTTISQVIAGGGGLTKIGAGTLTLTGIETFTGATTIGGGTLAIGAGGSIAASSAVNLAAAGAAFDISGGGNQTIRDLAGVGGTTVNLGGNVLTEGTGNSTTFAGTITGGGRLIKIGVGTLTLNGASTYSGGTTINAGAIGAGNSTALGTGPVIFNGGAVLAAANGLALANAFNFVGNGTFDTGGNTLTLAGAFSGAGALAKNGAGTLALTGNDSAFTGTATVNAGTLAVGVDAAPGAVLGGSVTAQNGGTVAGLGTINGSLANPSGIVAPGGSIGTLTVRGAYNQGANGTLQIEVNPAASSLLQVGGAATLAGRLNVIYDPGVYTARNYTILTASSVSGTFATLTATGLPNGFAQSFTVDPADVQLQLAAAVIAPVNDTVFTDATSVAVINGQRANSIILDRLGNRQAGVADGPVAAAAAPVQYAQAGVAAPLGAMASALPALTEGAWFRGIGGFTSVNGSAVAPGFTGTAGGFLAGYDRPIAPNVYIGIAGGYTHSGVNEHAAASGKIDTGRIALYGGGWWQQNLFTATAGYAHDSISTDRTFAGVGTATESHGGNEATVAAQWSHPLEVDGFGGGVASVTPKLGVQFLHLSEDSFTETGAGGLNLAGASRSTDSLQPYVGLAASQKFVTSDGTLITPELRLGYARETLTNSRLLSVTTVGGFNFPVVGVTPSRDNVTAGFGATMQAGPALSFYGNYDTILHTGNTTDHTVSAGLRIKF